MPKVVTINLRGGLGNQLFQAAATYAHALDIQGIAIFPDVPVAHASHSPYLEKLERGNIDIDKTIRENFESIELPNDSVRLYGYFQSPKYFDHRRKEILKLFSPPPGIELNLPTEYLDIIKRDDTVAIHVRRGDYLKGVNKDIFHQLPESSYYKDALARFDQKKHHFVIFSDDTEFAQKMHAFEGLKNLAFVKGLKTHEDLYLMSRCKNHIIANSSFSWWGAYLSENRNVVCPAKWFGPGAISEIGQHSQKASETICMDHWTKI